MQNLNRVTCAALGFAGGIWVMFLFMRSVIFQEFGPTGLAASASFIEIRNELLDDMVVVGFLAIVLTLLLCVLLLAENIRTRKRKK